VLEYRAIAYRQWRGEPYDAAVCNFSLLGGESVESLLAALGDNLAAGGYLIVQTLHPLAACGDNPYRDGWRAGNWLGFGAGVRHFNMQGSNPRAHCDRGLIGSRR
jgi:hypothetical protein